MRLMDEATFGAQREREFVESVRRTAQRTFDQAAYLPADQIYSVLAAELRRRGIEPDPEAVYEGALVISPGKKPRVLRQ